MNKNLKKFKIFCYNFLGFLFVTITLNSNQFQSIAGQCNVKSCSLVAEPSARIELLHRKHLHTWNLIDWQTRCCGCQRIGKLTDTR